MSWKNNVPLNTRIEFLDYVFSKHGNFNEYLIYSKMAYKEIMMQVVKHSVIQIMLFRSSAQI